MKVQKLQQQNITTDFNNKKNAPKFQGGADLFLRYLATNQAVGANGVDLAFMVIPRTASDMIRRGPVAGLETLRREIMGTINDSLIGVYGILTGAGLSLLINKKYGINANGILAAPETVNILAEQKHLQLKNSKSRIDYFESTLRNLKAFNPSNSRADKDGYVRLKEDTINKVAKIFDKKLQNSNYDKWINDAAPDSRLALMNIITEDLGTQGKFVLESPLNTTLKNGKTLTSETDLKILLNDIFKVSEAFEKDKVKEAFAEQAKNNAQIKDNEFIKKLTKFNKGKTLGGVLMAAAVGMSVQPINMYLSKLKTGTDGFVGVEGRQKDDSKGFFVGKCIAAAAFGAYTLFTMQRALPHQFLERMAFKGKWPTVNQLKGVYGLTIMSRLMSARDKDELRESLTKDFLGFTSWLILGDFVNKLVANGIDKSVIKSTEEMKKKGLFKRTFNSILKTRDEVVIEAFAQNGLSGVNKDGTAKTFKDMQKEIKLTDKISEVSKKAIKKRLRTLNGAQCAGYLFSGLVLGLGIPNLNIWITNTLDQKRKAKAAENKQSA